MPHRQLQTRVASSQQEGGRRPSVVPINYVLDANCSGFMKVARAMQMQGY